MSKSCLYPVFDMYRVATNQTPFVYRDTYTRRLPFKSDSMEGRLVVVRGVAHLPALTIRHDNDPSTGMPRIIGDVVIYDLKFRPVWTGVFDFTGGKWDSWELVRYSNAKCRGDLTGEDNFVLARINHLGEGACVMYSSSNRKNRDGSRRQPTKWVGYNGVDAKGHLKYALLHLFLTRFKVTPAHASLGAVPPINTPLPLVTFYPSDWNGPRMKWSHQASADGMGGVRAIPLFDGTRLQPPRASDRTPRSRGFTPMQEAFYLTGEDYTVIETGAYANVDNNTIRAFYKAAEWVLTITRETLPDRQTLAMAQERLTMLSLAVPKRTIANVVEKYGDKFNTALYCPAVVNTLAPDRLETAVPEHAVMSDAEFFK